MTRPKTADSRKRRSIAIAGNIGAGKSSLVAFLHSTYGVAPFYEPNEENPYLKDFYADMRRWAFHSQVYFLASKFAIHQRLDRTPGVSVIDRTLFEDAEIFARALHQMRCIDKRDWQTYRAFYRTILDAINPPDLLIYLRCPLRTLRKRIRLRGRPMEQDISPRYLKRLDSLYEDWIDRWDRSEVLVLESDRIDFVNDLMYRLDVMQRIEALLPRSLIRT